MTATFELFTNRYQAFRDGMGTPVQTSNGKPRWPLPYKLDFQAREVYPPWSLVKADLPEAEFAVSYRAHLDTVGVEAMASRFRAIAVASGEPRLVLMCFDDLAKPGWWCHRTMFGVWWTEQTGDEVRELQPMPDETERDVPLDF